MNYKNSNYRQ